MTAPDSAARTLLRHTLATLAYRAGKALRDAPEEFDTFRVAEGSRTPVEILAHMGDLLDWAAVFAGEGVHRWRDSSALPWEHEVDRFFVGLRRLDQILATSVELRAPIERIFQGPIADALQHTGQLTMLRRLAGGPVRGENYYRAEIVAGRVERQQAAPRREFD